MSAIAIRQPRIELFFKTDFELRERVRMLSAQGFSRFSLVNKNNDDPVVQWLDTCFAEVPNASVCAHYSLKYNRGKSGAHAAFGRFSEHLKVLSERFNRSEQGEQVEVLLISGSGAKAPLDTVSCLEKLTHQHSSIRTKNSHASVGVAYNPFMQNEDEAQNERDRLRRKLATGLVKSVWLQFGSDTALLRRGLEWIFTELDAELRPDRVVGSLFLPTKQLIAQQRFRPWNGVFLSDEYLSGPERAEAITKEILGVYAAFGVEILVEAPGVRSMKDVEALRTLLAHMPSSQPIQSVAATRSSRAIAAGGSDVGNSHLSANDVIQLESSEIALKTAKTARQASEVQGFASHEHTDWLLCTGQPGSGKTTLVKALVQNLALNNNVRLRGFYTEEVLGAGGSRIGFDVVTVPDGRRAVLSRKGGPSDQPKTGQYSVDVRAFESLAIPALADDEDASVVYVLDEIGRMELHSKLFASRVEALLARGVRLVGAITAPIYGHRVAFCDKVSATVGVAVHRITATVRDRVAGELVEEVRGRWSEPKSRDKAGDTIASEKRSRGAQEDGPAGGASGGDKGGAHVRKRPGRIHAAWSR